MNFLDVIVHRAHLHPEGNRLKKYVLRDRSRVGLLAHKAGVLLSFLNEFVMLPKKHACIFICLFICLNL